MKYRVMATALATMTLALIAASTPALAATYQWTDASGQMHFGDQPPGDATHVRELDVKGPPSLGGSGDDQSADQDMQQLIQQQQDEQERQKVAQQQQARARAARIKSLCADARHNLQVMNGRFRVKTPDGKSHDIPVSEIAAHKAKLQDWINANCQ